MRLISRGGFVRLVLVAAVIVGTTAGAGATTAATRELIDLQSSAADAETLPVHLRRAAAGIMLDECKAGLSHLPHEFPSTGLTEDAPTNFHAAQRELARWQLGAIFAACARMSEQIMAASDPFQEWHAWIELARLLAEEHSVRELIVLAELLPIERSDASAEDLFRISHWRVARDVIFTRVLGYQPMASPD